MSPLLLLLLAGAGDAFAECRRLDQSFDTAAMPAPCTAAVDDVQRPLADRTDAARLLAFALFTNGDVDGAETAFLRMLALTPTSKLPEGTSPRFAEAFSKARARFDAEGAVTVSAATAAVDVDDRLRFDADVVDLFGRAASVKGVLLSGAAVLVEVPLTAVAGGHWSGAAPSVSMAADGCRVEAVDAAADVVAAALCAPPVPVLEAEPPWLWIGVGAGAAVVVAAVGVGALLWAGTPPAPATVTVRIE